MTHNQISGTISLPYSKSISNRLLIIRTLSPDGFPIDGLSDSDDTKVLQHALNNHSNVVDIGHAGTSMRFLTAYFAATGQKKIMTGSDRMKNRPIGPLVNALNCLEANIKYLEKKGYPPIQTSGSPLLGQEVEIKGNISSQFISALLMIAPCLPNGLSLKIKGDLVSSSYIRMTLGLMSLAGVESTWENDIIRINPQTYRAKGIKTERDWSSASYWYEIVALAENAQVFLEGMETNSLQGDAIVAQLFQKLGVQTENHPEGLLLTKKGNLSSFLEYDFIDAPDIVQTMVVTACMLSVPFRFTGASTLRVKETDRIAALQHELLKLGYIIEEPQPGTLEWTGKKTNPQPNPSIATYHDHRMAMAFAPVALVIPELFIENPEVVNKSYPNFWKDLEIINTINHQVHKKI